MSDAYTNAVVRPAASGDRGVVRGATQEPGSGLATLTIETEDGTEILIDGDWRMIQRIVGDLEGWPVEVVEGDDGSLSVCPLDAIR